MRSNLFWLDDEQWARIEPHLPSDVRGKERVDDRRVISGILHVLKSGCRWKDWEERMFPTDVVIVAGARTPMARYTGSFSEVSAIDLGAHAGKAAVQRAGWDALGKSEVA